jgi:hypothetical protein
VGRNLLIALLLLASSFQSFIAQTHVHRVPTALPCVHSLRTQSCAPAGKREALIQPAEVATDAATCQFCQAVAQTGAVLPSERTISLALAAANVVVALPAPQVDVGQVLRSNSRQRGPPPHA